MEKQKLSVVMPVFNEERTILAVLERVQKVRLPFEKEIIVVDDGSTDSSLRKIQGFAKKNSGVEIVTKKNGGKGSAVRAGFKFAKGTIIVVLDADLEYDPAEIPAVISPIVEGRADVVFGSRFKGKITGKKIVVHYIGNKFLSLMTTLLFFHWVSDMETCYKAFNKNVLDSIKLNADRFDFEPEVTAKILKKGYRFCEVKVDYAARSFEEGKKIGIRDGFSALKTLIKYRFVD